jgi:hypothetical protein
MSDKGGDVRFADDESLEVFDGAAWVPLERLPDLPIGVGRSPE